jgi:hypothetical protein
VKPRALLFILLIAAVAAGVYLLVRGGRGKTATTDTPATAAADAGAAATAKKPPALPPGAAIKAGGDSAATGQTVIKAAWGSQPGQLGHKREDEGNAEGPMSLGTGPDGSIYVLDQVNRRVQHFGPDGKLLGSFDIGPDTTQDMLVDGKGRVTLLDRLGDGEVTFYDDNGKQLGQVPVVGGAIDEGGGVSGMIQGPDGLYLEREHVETVRVAGPDGKPDPDRPTQPGRPTRDGAFYLAALIADAQAGTAIVRAFDHDAKVAWARAITFVSPIIHLVFLDSDAKGHVYVAAFVGKEGLPPSFDMTDTAIIVVRLGEPDGAAMGAITLQATGEPEEIFRELAVTDDGQIVQLYPTKDGIEVRRYTFPD